MDYSTPPPGQALQNQNKVDMNQLRQQLDMYNLTEILQKMTDKCFNACIQKPGTSLGNSDTKCISMCMDRYNESYEIVFRAYMKRLTQESHM